MRYIVTVPDPLSKVKRLMIHDSPDGVYLFEYNTLNDTGGIWDDWYETFDDALEAAYERHGIKPTTWNQIADPLDNCQQDWIMPVRVKGRETGKPEWGKFERLVNGQWEEFHPKPYSNES